MAGAWGEQGSVRAVNGTALDWAEGVRKWGKHTGGGEFEAERSEDEILLLLITESETLIRDSIDTEYIHLLRTVSLAYLPLGATSPTDHASIPQLRSQPLHLRETTSHHGADHQATTHREPTHHETNSHQTPDSTTDDAAPVVLAPVAPVEGYQIPSTTSNASSASSAPSRGIDTHSAGSSTDRTESSSSFIHVSHNPEEEERPYRGDRRGPTAGLGGLDVGEKEGLAVGMAAEKPTEDSGSGVTITQPRTTTQHATTHPPPHPAAMTNAPPAFLSPSYLDGDDAETGIPCLAAEHWWIGPAGLQGEARADVEEGLRRVTALQRGGSIAQTRVSQYFFLVYIVVC